MDKRSLHLPTPQSDLSVKSFEEICRLGGIMGVHTAREIAAYTQAIRSWLTATKSTSASLVEIGCGFGRISPELAQISGVTSYTGVETHPEYVQAFRENHPHLEVLHENFFALDETKRSGTLPRFDILVAPYAVFHLFDFEQQIQFLKKARALARCVILDLILIEQYGCTENAVRTSSSEEFKIDYASTNYYPLLKEILKHIPRESIQSVIGYPFCKGGDGKDFTHDLLILWEQ